MALIESLESGWYGQGRVAWWTWPLTALYGSVTACRRWLYRLGVLRRVQISVPVIVVGNLTVGGAGKTPLTIAMAAALRARGYRPGVVSRGYGGSQREPILMDDASEPSQVGDEPCLIRATGTAVAVGRDRPAAARLLVDAGCNVVIADDGLQHYALARDVEICVIDGVRRFGNRHLLPAGPLREPMSRLQQVDFRVCNGGTAETGEYPMQLMGGTIKSLVGGQRRTLAEISGSHVHAVAAIGNPQRFFDSLRAAGLQLTEHPFPDHHVFTADDLDFSDDLPVLMTDKDAVKCTGFARAHWWRVPVQGVLSDDFFNALEQRVRAVNRRD